MAEWTKAADCKSVSYTLVGSNPTPFIIFQEKKKYYTIHWSKIRSAYWNAERFSSPFYSKFFSEQHYFQKKANLVEILNVHKMYKHFFLYPTLPLATLQLLLFRKVSKKKLLLLSFKKNNTSIILKSFKLRTHYFTFTLGSLFSSFLTRKNMKKSRKFKLLLPRFLRKVLLLINTHTVSLLIQGVPENLAAFILSLTKPINHSYNNPFRSIAFAEKGEVTPNLKFQDLTFRQASVSAKIKKKKKGKVKRKVLRKIIYRNKVSD